MSRLDVDTCPDVYSLAYSCTSYSPGRRRSRTVRFREAGYSEIGRLIREVGRRGPAPVCRRSASRRPW